MHCLLFFLVFFFGDMVISEGHRFRPTPEELVNYLLEKMRDLAFTSPYIKDVDIYKYHPSELPGLFSSCQSDDNVWFLFCTLGKYGKSDKFNRRAKGGSWKITGKDQLVEATDSNTICIKKILVFKDYNDGKENNTSYTMHEYHCNQQPGSKDQVVLCRIERKTEKKRKPSRIDRKPDKKHKPSSSLDNGPASDSGYNDAQDISEVEPRLQANQNIPDVTKNISPEVRPLVPALQDEPVDCIRVCHRSLSTFQSPIYQTPGSSYSSSFSNDSAHWLVQNSFSALQSPIHLPPESSYSCSFSNDATNGLNHSSLSGLQLPIHPQPGSSHSSGFSNDATNHSSFSALQWPIHPQPGSSHSNCFSNGSNVWTPQSASEQEDDLANSRLMKVKSDQLQPNQHTSYVTTNGFPELGSQLLPNQHISSNGEDHVAKYIHHQNPSDWLDHNSFSALWFPIHPLPESPYSSGFSNGSTNELNHSSFSSLQLPIHPQPGSSHSSCFSNGSNVWTPQSAYEQEDDLANSRLMEVKSDQLQPNQHTSYVTTNGFPESESQLPPKQHKSSNGEDLVAKSISSELEPLISGKPDAIDGLQSPISSVFGDDSIVWNTLLGSESEDDFQNLKWEF
ncbi:hypothetical protein QYF36_018901 [Acer negundo]|nr:hypothetical protein QYF36_018901 [Acer negundo]